MCALSRTARFLPGEVARRGGAVYAATPGPGGAGRGPVGAGHWPHRVAQFLHGRLIALDAQAVVAQPGPRRVSDRCATRDLRVHPRGKVQCGARVATG